MALPTGKLALALIVEHLTNSSDIDGVIPYYPQKFILEGSKYRTGNDFGFSEQKETFIKGLRKALEPQPG